MCTGYPDLAVLHYIDVEIYARRETDGWWTFTSIKRLLL